MPNVPMPKPMRTLERDSRGYPVPFIVLRDTSGKPQFTINDTRQVAAAQRKRLCAICGKRLEAEVWFVGGARCFIHPHGAFVDPPLHHDCGEYALQVCPFLAMPVYAKRIEAKKLDPRHIPEGLGLAFVPYMPPNQPERFGFGCTADFELFTSERQGDLYRVHHWRFVEWWRNGERVNAPDWCPADQPWVNA